MPSLVCLWTTDTSERRYGVLFWSSSTTPNERGEYHGHKAIEYTMHIEPQSVFGAQLLA